jgi:hypothetical protein
MKFDTHYDSMLQSSKYSNGIRIRNIRFVFVFDSIRIRIRIRNKIW